MFDLAKRVLSHHPVSKLITLLYLPKRLLAHGVRCGLILRSGEAALACGNQIKSITIFTKQSYEEVEQQTLVRPSSPHNPAGAHD